MTDSRARTLSDPRVRGALGVGALFLAVQLLALAVAPRLAASGVSYGEGGDALVPLVLGLVAGTALSLAVGRFGVSERVVRTVMFGSLGVALWVALAAFVGVLPGAVGAAVGAGLAWREPRWEVRNAVAVVAVAGAAGLFGASLSPPYAVGALAAAAAYDAYAVYVTGHMAAVAEASARMRIPAMFLVPSGGDGPDEAPTGDADGEGDGVNDGEGDGAGVDVDAAGGEPAATVLGTGDALFPAVLTASATVGAASTAPVGELSPSVVGLAPRSFGALVGSLVGFAALQVLVQRNDGMHAGLPFVNGGAILGYVLVVSLGATVA